MPYPAGVVQYPAGVTNPQPLGVETPRPVPSTNTLALIGFIGVWFVSIVGIVLGIMAQRQIQVTGEAGAGLAKAAVILGVVFTVLQVLFFIVWAVFFFSAVAASPTFR